MYCIYIYIYLVEDTDLADKRVCQETPGRRSLKCSSAGQCLHRQTCSKHTRFSEELITHISLYKSCYCSSALARPTAGIEPESNHTLTHTPLFCFKLRAGH